MLRKVIVYTLSLILLCTSGTVFLVYANDINNETMSGTIAYDHTYSITCDSVDWHDYSVQEKVEMLRIPSEKLVRMTDGKVDGDMNKWHSAIYITETNSGIPLASQMCVSKWGSLGVFEHSIGNVPAAYDRSWISAWREV